VVRQGLAPIRVGVGLVEWRYRTQLIDQSPHAGCHPRCRFCPAISRLFFVSLFPFLLSLGLCSRVYLLGRNAFLGRSAVLAFRLFDERILTEKSPFDEELSLPKVEVSLSFKRLVRQQEGKQ
jgi:hypothetical protein